MACLAAAVVLIEVHQPAPAASCRVVGCVLRSHKRLILALSSHFWLILTASPPHPLPWSIQAPHAPPQAPFNTKVPPGWFCMYRGHLKTTLMTQFVKFRFCLNLGICLNWGRVQTCPSRSGRFTTRAIQGVTTRTRRSGFFLVQIVLEVRLFLRSAFHLFPHLPKKKKQQARSQQSWRVRSSPSSMTSSTIPSFGHIMGLA